MARHLLALAALSLAKRDVGVREVPLNSNRGPRVDVYLRTAGEDLGEPYCASADFTWYNEAAHLLGMANPMQKTGYCPYLVNWGRSQGLLQPAHLARPGDPVVYWSPRLGRFYHTGLCSVNHGGGVLSVVEANTNDDGSAEGDGVYLKTRATAGTKHVCINMQGFGVDVTETVPLKVYDMKTHALLLSASSGRADMESGTLIVRVG